MDKIVDKFDFMGHSWTVKYEPIVILDGKVYIGKINASTCIIHISTDTRYPDSVRLSTLLHELIHMVDHLGVCGIGEDTTGILETLIFDLMSKGGIPNIEWLEKVSEDYDVCFSVKRFYMLFDKLQKTTSLMEVIFGR